MDPTGFDIQTAGMPGPAGPSAAEAATAAAMFARYGISPATKGGIWDLSLWETCLFQDAGATVPATAAGDPVGCIRNALGDASWDLVQADDALRLTLQFRDGVPYCNGTAKGMLTRAVHNITMPFWTVAGLGKISTGYNKFGMFSRPKSHAFTNGALGSAALYNDFGAAIFVHTPFYSIPDNSFAVFDAVTSEGITSIRFNNGGEEAAYSPLATPAMPDGYTAATAIIGLNVGGQAFTGQALADPNPVDVEFYGGAALMMVPSEQQRETLVSGFRRQIEPEMRSTDKIILIDGDSTTDDINNATTEMGAGMFQRWASETGTTYGGAQVLRDVNPTDTIYYRPWASRGTPQQWGGWRMVQEGNSGRRIFVENASVSGTQPSYHMAGRFAAVFGIHPHIDEIIWTHGHNMAINYAAVPVAYEKYLRTGELTDAMDKVRRAFPTAAHMIVEPHPIMTVGNDGLRGVKSAYDYAATLYGDLAVADIYTPWLAARPQPTWTDEGVHPSMPTGVTQQLNITVPIYNAWQSAKPAVIAPALLGRGSSAINLNPLLDDFDSAVPDNRTKVGAGTVMRSTLQVDTELDDNYSVRLSGVVYLEESYSAVPYRGQVVTVAARQYLEPGGDGTLGQISLSSDGTNAVPLGNSFYSSGGKPTGAWRWVYHTAFVPADANTIKLRTYGTAAGAGVAYWGRNPLFASVRPKDIR